MAFTFLKKCVKIVTSYNMDRCDYERTNGLSVSCCPEEVYYWTVFAAEQYAAAGSDDHGRTIAAAGWRGKR